MIPRKILVLTLALTGIVTAGAKNYYISPNGNDMNAGSVDKPFRTLAPAQKLVQPGDFVYFREGTYKPQTSESMGTQASIYSCVYLLDKSGTQGSPISYMAYPGEKVVFDLSDYKPEGMRVSVFYVSGDWLHLKNLEVIGTQVTIADGSNTQSEVFSNRGGNYNIYENLKMHDGMAIGFYLVKGGNNLVLNCDAWNNYDEPNGGGNTDGFGMHPSEGDTGNVLRGCRAWWNSDDGFYFIHSAEAVRIENCWAFYNGYKPGEFKSAGDGNGIKAGGYGMNPDSKIAAVTPTHEVINCLAFYNKTGGIYSNHHLGGLDFINNTSIHNRWNYNMPNRKSAEENVDVDGYGHFLANNVAYNGREKDLHQVDFEKSIFINNTFGPSAMELTDADFQSLEEEELILPRKSDGSLPDINFGKISPASLLYGTGIGYENQAPTKEELLGFTEEPETPEEPSEEPEEEDPEVIATQWIMAPYIMVEDNSVWIEGEGAENLNGVYVNGVKMRVSKGKADISTVEDTEINIRATLSNGVVMLKKFLRTDPPQAEDEDDDVNKDIWGFE